MRSRKSSRAGLLLFALAALTAGLPPDAHTAPASSLELNSDRAPTTRLAQAAPLPVRLKQRAVPVTSGDLPPAPVTLSDPDGQEMRLEDLSVRAAVQGPLALTELELRFRNPHARRMEGRFTCVLPAGATISRFAKEVDGQLMEGEVVERLQANRVYDTILHEMRDPALLEQDQGNRFSARVFPIEAHATVRLVLSYTQLLTADGDRRTYTLPLRGLPTMERFTFHGLFAPLPGEVSPDLEGGGGDGLEAPSGARRSTVQVLDLDEARFTPAQDLQVSWSARKAPPVQLLQAGDFYLARFKAPDTGLPTSAADGPFVFYVDTSASSAEGMAHRVTALEALLRALPDQAPVEVIAFDQRVVPLEKGSAGAVARQVGTALRTRGFLGGTDLEQALRAINAQAGKARSGTRFVLVTDGVATLGRTDRKDLIDAASSLPAQVQLHALVLGARQDAPALEAITAGRGRVVPLPFTEGLDRHAQTAAASLQRPPGVTFSLRDPGAEWLFPAIVRDVAPGSEIITVGRLKPASRPAVELVRDGRPQLRLEADVRPLPLGAFEPLLEREGYRAYLAYLAEREATETSEAVRRALATEQVKVSVERRVLIPRTTLLVLESEADYARFGLDRRALASILTVGPTGIERLDRSRPVTAPPQPAKPVTAEQARRAQGRPEATRSRPLADDAGKDDRADEKGKLADFAPRDAANMDLSVAEGGEEEKSLEADAAPGEMQAGAGGSMSLGASGDAAAPMRSARIEARSRETAAPGLSREMDESEEEARPEPRPAIAPSAPPPAPVASAESERRSRRRSRQQAGTTRPVTPAEPSMPAWTEPYTVSDAALADLEAAVTAAPRNREGYNRLSEALFARGDWKRLREVATAWQAYDPENPQVYESLGEAALNLKLEAEAQRAFASLVEVAPAKPELLQRAGLLLLRAGEPTLAEVPLRRALELRPDRANGYRHLALLLWQQGRLEEAARVLEDALQRTFPDWYGQQLPRVLREELGYVYRAWLAAEPGRSAEIRRRAARLEIDLERLDALRVTLAWETDANDVDLHVVDPKGEECYYSHKETAAGLELYEDITRGFGPEVIRAGRLEPGVYHVGVNYFSAGPMGVSRGILVVMQPGAGKQASIRIVPFRLVNDDGERDMRHLARIEVR